VADVAELGDLVREVGLGVLHRLVVDGGGEFLQEEVEYQPRLEVADVLVELFGEEPLDGPERLLLGVLLQWMAIGGMLTKRTLPYDGVTPV
jgi:hypothetical protein